MKKYDRDAFVMEAIYKELDLAGVSHSVLEKDKEWFSNNTMNQQQHQQWREWFIAESRKRFRLTKKLAEKEFSYFDLSYGLRIAEKQDNG